MPEARLAGLSRAAWWKHAVADAGGAARMRCARRVAPEKLDALFDRGDDADALPRWMPSPRGSIARSAIRAVLARASTRLR
ncbi:MAG: hypothetical protein KIT18_05725 [Burkholderiales bacterium]|nr:hypothetical protein [Burkholderiales bacterium]